MQDIINKNAIREYLGKGSSVDTFAFCVFEEFMKIAVKIAFEKATESMGYKMITNVITNKAIPIAALLVTTNEITKDKIYQTARAKIERRKKFNPFKKKD